MMEFVNAYGLVILGAVLVACAGMLGRFLHRLALVHLDTPAKQTAARIAVHYVEQIARDLDGEKKLKIALDTAAALLKKKGVKWTAEEMTVIIEAMVEEMNEYLKPPLLETATAEAVFRPDNT